MSNWNRLIHPCDSGLETGLRAEVVGEGERANDDDNETEYGFLIITNHSHFYSSTERHYRHSLDSSRLGLSAVSLSSLRNSN